MARKKKDLNEIALELSLMNFRDIYKKVNNGIPCTIGVLKMDSSEVIFGVYHRVFDIFIKRGLITIKLLDDIKDDEEFMVIL